MWIPVLTFLCVEKLRTAPACIRPYNSAARLDDSQCSIKLQDFFPKHRYGKIAATVQTRSSIRQVLQFKSRLSDASQHGLDARALDIEIAFIRSAIRTTILQIRTREAFIWNYLQRTCDLPDGRATPSGRGSQTRKFFSKIFRISVAQLSVWTSYDHYPKRRPVLLS